MLDYFRKIVYCTVFLTLSYWDKKKPYKQLVK